MQERRAGGLEGDGRNTAAGTTGYDIVDVDVEVA